MKLLFVGSSSSISQIIEKNLKRKVVTISTKKKKSKNHFTLKSYSSKDISILVNKLKLKNEKFDTVVFFNGFHRSSTLSFFDKKIFNKIIKINITVPMQITSEFIKKDLLNKTCSIIYIGSIAAELNEIGNAYYSMAKSLLPKCIRILSKEQKKKYRFNILSLGLVKNKMSKNLIKNTLGFYNNKKFVNIKILINKFKKIIDNKKINGSIIKEYGGYDD
jgi:short-subunit dehydrogenase